MFGTDDRSLLCGLLVVVAADHVLDLADVVFHHAQDAVPQGLRGGGAARA